MALSCWLAIFSLRVLLVPPSPHQWEDKNKIKDIVSLSCPRPHLLCGGARPLRFLPRARESSRVAHTRCTSCSGLPFDLCPCSFPLQPPAVRPAVLKVQPSGLSAIQGALLRVLSVDVFLEGVQPMHPSWEQGAWQRGAAPARLSHLLLHSNIPSSSSYWVLSWQSFTLGPRRRLRGLSWGARWRDRRWGCTQTDPCPLTLPHCPSTKMAPFLPPGDELFPWKSLGPSCK